MWISEIVKHTKGKWLQQNADAVIEDFVIDTRTIKTPQQALFVAINAVRNGHDFIADAYKKGVRAFMVSDGIDVKLYPAANFIEVAHTVQALQQLAQQHRATFELPVIGITGSNGKTVIKEWLFQLLSVDQDIVKSPKSYNSQIGVALSVLQMEAQHKLAIFEAGISQPGEMQKLAAMIKPNIGVFTNIGEAHSEGFLNERQKINEKLQLFSDAEVLVYCKDYLTLHENIVQYTHQLKDSKRNDIQMFDWSRNKAAMLRILRIETEGINSCITALYHDEEITIHIPFKDKAYVEDAIHCWCVLLYLGVNQADIQQRMRNLQPIAMRLELKHGINNSLIINDTYNSDLTSLIIAMDFLDQQKQNQQKMVILSDMFQIGKPDVEIYQAIVTHIKEKNIKTMIGIGSSFMKYQHIFQSLPQLESFFYPTTEVFIQNITALKFDNTAILLKGARSFKFEKIEKILVDKIHNTVLEINLSDMVHNLNVYRAMLAKDVKIMAMVKAYSYGSGSYEIANVLQYAGVDYLTVAYLDEGITLREAGITLPIMVMNPDISMFDRMIVWKLEPEIYNHNSLHQIIEIVKQFDLKAYPIHLKLDTGMHRLGFEAHEIDEVIATLKDTDTIQVTSIFSHLVGSDSNAFDDFTAVQHQRFETMSMQIQNAVPYKIIRHLSNTAAVSSHKHLQYDMVRLGIGLYGIDATRKIEHLLKPIGTLKTHITQIKHLAAGETVGYSRKGRIAKASTIATVNIGYADGYFRDFGNGRAYMLVNGQPAPIVGVVCMDMCMLDVTDIDQVSEGDEVIVFGKALHIQQLAEWANTIPYEVLTGISQRVKRIYIND